MTQMADKDRPCTALRFLHPTPVSVFNLQSRMEEVEKTLLLREGEEMGWGGGRVKKRDKEWESSGSLKRNSRALEAIYRPQGGGCSGDSAADTGITNNSSRNPVYCGSERKEGHERLQCTR